MNEPRVRYGLVIHGGVGTLPRKTMTPSLAEEYRETLRRSLMAGYRALEAGDGADAVVAAITVMEDSPLFNAGRGSNFDAYGAVTMDASIMVGADRAAGAVAGVTDVRNPIQLARLVIERSSHVMLSGFGAESFARANGIPRTPPSFFHTDRRWKMLEEARAEEARDGVVSNPIEEGLRDPSGGTDIARGSTGTVGAVALDRDGRLAAGTSTGGACNKRWGRIGDSPVIGAGTYASAMCAVSCTGYGEAFIRHAVAHDVCARMEYLGEPLAQACAELIGTRLVAEGAAGGLVAVDREGRVQMAFNTEGMYRGYVGESGIPWVGLYAGEGPSGDESQAS